ncbi:hypothetical protein [Tenacibaculum discolor]|uniref:hypothetical protein n=1 Tax=Tenacibaculum discolor TaxID=361581 RepID=UPI003F7AB558
MNLNREKCIAFGKDPDYVIEKLKSIDEKLSFKILKRFNKEINRSNFISLLSELKFINEFSNLNFSIDYEKKYKTLSGEKTPDLTLDFKGCKLLGEVYRLGSSSQDNQTIQFLNKVENILSEIKSSYILFLEFKNKSIDFKHINEIDLKEKIQNWISTKPKLNSILDYNSDLEFHSIIKGKNQYTQLISDVIILNIKPEKLQQIDTFSNNEITNKILKYEEIVQQKQIPYFICIETDLNSGFHFSDYFERFHHKEVEYKRFEKHEDFLLKQGKGKYWSTLGDFYLYPFLSGLIILINNEFRMLLSPLKTQIIYNEKYKESLKFLTQKFASIT